MNSVEMTALGVLRTDFRQKFGTPRQGALATHSRARLDLAPKWRGRGILDGLGGFSHAWLITHLHLSENTRVRGKVHPPRLLGQKIGILASRSPHRPNNLGLTLAKIVEVRGDDLLLSAVDIVDGTPILDVKPYVAQADRPLEFREGWLETLPERKPCLTVFAAEASKDLDRISAEPERVRALLAEMLALDPRPPAYLGREDQRFAIYLLDLNVVMSFCGGTFTVWRIEKIEPPGPGRSVERSRGGSEPRPSDAALHPGA